MSGVYTAAATVCASCVVISLLSRFVTDGGTKKLLTLVLGAFAVVALIFPLRGTVSEIVTQIETAQAPEQDESVAESCRAAVLAQTKANLEQALTDILAQNGIAVKSAEVVLAIADESRVVISSVTLTVSEETARRRDDIDRLTEEHFAVRPQIVTQESDEADG